MASSDYPRTDSLTDRNPDLLPCFQESLLGKDCAVPAVDLSSDRKYLFLSLPVRNSSGTGVIGVAISELPFAEIAQAIEPDRYQGIIALTGPDDLVFFSNRPELENRFLWQRTSPEKLAGPNQERGRPPPGPGPDSLKSIRTRAWAPSGKIMPSTAA